MEYSATQIFVPGGMPELTYVTRSDLGLEQKISSANENLCKLVTVTGTTKSGKTVLVNKIFPKNRAIWIDGGTVKSEDDFWGFVLEDIGGFSDSSKQYSAGVEYGFGANIEGEGGIPFITKIKGILGSTFKRSREEVSQRRLTLTSRVAAITQMRKTRRPLIIDDFHYMDRVFQGNIIRALKPLIFEGIPIILIAIPHRRYDAVKVEREITGRLEPIRVPSWEAKELVQIPNLGFPLLNVEIKEEICYRLVKEAYGSPHLMQEFCREISQSNNIIKYTTQKKEIINVPDEIFLKVAEQTGKVIYDKLAKGPRQRSDRMQRKLRNGKTADIYKVILLALSHLHPGLDTINYETLRSSIRDVLSDNIPQAHEVTRVLEQMSLIASSDEASTPVLDWEKDEQRLHITDPFFAFYLKWGVDQSI